MIDIKTLKQLVRLMKDNDLYELDARNGDEEFKLKRGGGGAVQYVPQPAPPVAAAAPVAASAAASSGGAVEEADADAGLLKILSPMVGTFYSAPNPDTDAFVKVGSKVGVDTVVCLVEAMKVFNEIKAEVSGTIEKVLVESGQAIDYNTPLFLVRP
ncbi:MAG: acetyl-CoA carboxylase biotin carboxyl carrier protein [Phycisphaera sp.]|nr:acetyl-CoA carboxylase biotin carboxyl carrier protein [Phycisphaera sp.]